MLWRALPTAVLLVPTLAFAWGFDGHRRLASMMQDPLPQNLCIRAWMKSKQTVALQDSACDPDRNRITGTPGYDPLEAVRHYLEIDWVNPPSTYPRDYAAVVQQLGATNANRNGRVPWRVEEQYAALVAAFASKNETQILDTVFFFSHYVMDSFSMLHDTKNYDPDGLHQRWESDMFGPNAQLNGITNLAVTYYGTPGRADPRNNIFDIILAGNAQVPALIAADVATTNDAGIHDNVAFYNAVRDMTARRWGDGATLMASFIWSAWTQAGSPLLTGFPAGCSMSVPSQEIVLKGFPPVGGFLHPGTNDGGFTFPDAGSTGGGAGGSGGSGGGAAAGGGSGGGGSTGGGTGGGTGSTGGGTGSTGGGTGSTGGGTGGGSGAGGAGGGDMAGGGMGGGDAGGEGGGGEAPPPVGCSCASPGGLVLAALALLLARARRR